MRTSDRGLAMLAGLEGICLTKYKDSVGVWTIGIGATRTEIPDIAKWPRDRTLTIEQCFSLLKQSIKKYERAINKNIKVGLQQHEFDALVSWCYNVGTGWANRASVIKLLNQGIRGKRIYDALMMYKKPKEIIGRRKKEAKLLVDGVYSGDGKALVFPVSKNGHPIYSRGYSVNVFDYLPLKDEPHYTKPKEEDVVEPEITKEEKCEECACPPTKKEKVYAFLLDKLKRWW